MVLEAPFTLAEGGRSAWLGALCPQHHWPCRGCCTRDSCQSVSRPLSASRGAAGRMESVQKLLLAAEHGSEEDLRLLLSYPYDNSPDDCTSTGRTALHTAALHNHTGCAEVLLNHGASIDFADQNCNTALHIAALNGNCGMISLLIRRGANINAVTRVRCPHDLLYDCRSAIPSPRSPPICCASHKLTQWCYAFASLNSQKAKTPFALACQGGCAEAARILACTGCYIPIGTTVMDEYRRLAKFMDRKAAWLKTKQVLALLDNLEKVAPPDWGDWFRHEWPAVLSDIATTQKEDEEVDQAITVAIERTTNARMVAMKMQAASAAQKKNRLRKQAEEEAARIAAEEAAERDKLQKEKEEQGAAERAAVEAQKARDEAARLQRVKAIRDQELARAHRFQEEAAALASGEGISSPESSLLPLQPEPEPEPDGRVTFSHSALRGGTMIGGSDIPAAPTGRAHGFSDVNDRELPLGQPPPPSTPPPPSPPSRQSTPYEAKEPGSAGDGAESTYQRSRYEMARQASSPTSPSRLVNSPRWALTGGVNGEGQLVNHSSHLGSITSPTRVGGLGAEPRGGAGTNRAFSRNVVDTVRRDTGILPGSMGGLHMPGGQDRVGGSPRRAYEQPVVEVIGVDGRRREGLSLSPRTDSSVLRSAPLSVQAGRRFTSGPAEISSSYRYSDHMRTLSPSRSSSRPASSLLSVRSPVRPPR